MRCTLFLILLLFGCTVEKTKNVPETGAECQDTSQSCDADSPEGCVSENGGCLTSSDCCQSDSYICVSGVCSRSCISNQECESGCCASWSTETLSGYACAPQSVCEAYCVGADESCSVNGDCCGDLVCVNQVCATSCLIGEDCESECCARFTTAEGATGRACAPSSICE